MSIRYFLLVGSCALVSAALAAAGSRPVAVSPGHIDAVALVESRCPTFSWGEVEGAASYELVVYRLGKAGEEAPPVLRQRLAGSVYGWTPSLVHCLDRGGRYAWSVRAVGEKGAFEWSAPSLFEVASGPSEVEFERALTVVRDYLATRDGVAADGVVAVRGSAESMQKEMEAASLPETPAVGTTQLTVEGGVVAASFTGDGSALTDLDPANLSGQIEESQIADEIARDREVTALIAAIDRECPGAVGSGNRYTDCGNGTVRDNNMGLFWLKNANCFDLRFWAVAESDAATLKDGMCGLTDGSVAGDWRQPTISEFCSAWSGSVLFPCPAGAASDSLIDSSVGPPVVVNAAGTGVWMAGDAFVGVQSGGYSSATEIDAELFWRVGIGNGNVLTGFKIGGSYVWPVRGGQ